jgi:hypothetical protein
VAKNVKTVAGNLFGEHHSGADESPMLSTLSTQRGAGAKRTISDLHFPEAIFAAKEAQNCSDLRELQGVLVSRLGQNSQETRLRYARFLIRWFFPDGIHGIACKTWAAFNDESILIDILRFLYLSNETVMGVCVAECLFPIDAGMKVPASIFDRFLSSHYGGAQTKKTTQRLKSNLMRLGILARSRGEEDRLRALNPTKTSLLLLTHYLFAPAELRTIELRNLLARPFWKYIGLKREDEVRAILREADAAGFLGKYVVADQLEQVTTCMTLDEFMSKKVRL